MTLSTFVGSTFLNNVAGTDLASYVPQSGDVAGTSWVKAVNSTLTGATLVLDTNGLRVGASATGTNDIRYENTVTATSSEIDVTVDFLYETQPAGTSFPAILFAADGTATNWATIYVSAGKIFLQRSGDTAGASVAVANGVLSALVAGTTYTMKLSVRNTGTGGIPQVSVVCGTKGGTLATIIPATNMSGMVVAGRRVGVRMAWSAGANNSTATTGYQFQNFVAENYTVATSLAVSPPTVAAATQTTAAVTSGGVTGGTAPFSRQFQRATITSGTVGSYANVGTAGTATSVTDTGLTPGAQYSYREVVTDSAGTPATVTSTATTYNAPSGSFSVATAPASMALSQGQALTLSVSPSPSGGYVGNVALSAIGLPTGVTAAFNPASVAMGGTSVLTLTAAGNAITGATSITVRSTDGTITQDAPVALQVNPPTGVVYPVVANILDTDLVTITRSGTTEQVAASVLKGYLAA
jgi:hypothetical protein